MTSAPYLCNKIKFFLPNKTVFCNAKHAISGSESNAFGSQNAAYQTLKGGISQCKVRHFTSFMHTFDVREK